jgi:hypothetical protein
MSTQNEGPNSATPDAEGARGILTTTKDRVAEILEATDRAVSDIMDAANRESEQLVRETHQRAERLAAERMERISSLTEGVMAKAATLDLELEKMRKLVDDAVGALAAELGLEQPARATAPKPPGAAPAGDEDRGDALQLLATQLLISGETYESASRRMAEEFGVQNPRFVLDSLDLTRVERR